MNFTYYGQSCFKVVINNKHLLFDPFITGNELAKDININEIKADYIFLSHGHGDHVADAESIAKRTGAKIVAAYEVANWYADKGITNNHPMNHGGKWAFDFGTVKCVNAIHSSVMPDGKYGGNPMGFVVTSSEGNFYYSGDTALTLDMQLIPRYADIDFAVLPIGDNFTMGIDDAAEAAVMVKTKQVIAVHYDTFDYIKIDKKKAWEIFQKHGLDLKMPGIGETIEMVAK